ncbi:MAG: hypothetical protein FWG98_03790 [Candidatus Cloacimonetes bacterium]|nr:hypothetical protein [Candidatus Cloacimonadota bacterium]
MFYRKKIILLILFGMYFFAFWRPSLSLYAEVFGKNKVQQSKIDWSLIESRYFDIYFVTGHEELGKMTVLIAENAYFHLYQFFQHPLLNRIPIIVYSSKQDFQTTNIIYPLLPEGIGGFTETYRNRVALPFDGSIKKFEDVLVHELVHAYINDMEGTFFRNPLFRGVTSNLPFWFSEGLPEYLALKGTNVYNSKFIIDMIINDQLRDIEFLGGFFAYRLGEAILVWISEEWDEDKVIEYFYNVRLHAEIHSATKQTFGFDFTELQDRFRLYVKRKYSHLINEMQTPWEVATRHTNSRETNNAQNVFPRFSPNGTDFVFFSTHKARTSIFRGSSFQLRKDEVIVRGEKTARFEEFHYQRNNLAWFPSDVFSDSSDSIIAFVAKTTFGDMIYFYDVIKKRVIEQRDFPQFDSIYEIDISPCGEYLAITAQMDNRCDLFIYNIFTRDLKRITDDNFFTFSPNWSIDGTKLSFVSERVLINDNPPPPDTQDDNDVISSPNIFGQMVQNIYYYDINAEIFYQITNDDFNNFHPIWIDDTQVAFITEKTGIANIDIVDISKNERATVTNILTGMQSFDYSSVNDLMIFSVYFNNAYEIFTLNKPFNDLNFSPYNTNISIEFSNDFHDYFRTDRFRFYGRDIEAEEIARREEISNRRVRSSDITPTNQRPRNRWDNNMDANEYEINDGDLRIDLFRHFPRGYNLDLRPDTQNYQSPIIRNYKPRFQIDSFWGGFAYSPAYGSIGLLQLGMSDIMGDHGIGISMDFNGHFEESNIILSYMYLPHRIDYGFALYNFVDYYLYRLRFPTPVHDYIENRQYQSGIFLMTRYPFSRFFRVDLDHSFYRYRSEWHLWNRITDQWEKESSETDYIYAPQLSFVFDNALFGSVGPMTGSRLTTVVRHSFSQKDNTFTTAYADLRNYALLSNRFSLANRLYIGVSEGERPENFTLTSFSGVRGVNDRSIRGNRKVATSLELRYPFIDFLRLGFPLPITITNIRGSVFTDIGSVWDNEDFRGMEDSKLKDIKLGFGFGPRLNLGFIVLRMDMAWTSDFVNHSKPSIYILLAEDF